jgi:hypothetical protein
VSVVRLLFAAHCLLYIRISKARTTTTATVMPADAGMKYKSAADAGVDVGSEVVGCGCVLAVTNAFILSSVSVSRVSYWSCDMVGWNSYD